MPRRLASPGLGRGLHRVCQTALILILAATASHGQSGWAPEAEEAVPSYGGAINSNGRYITLTSYGTRLAPGQNDGNSLPDAFLFDRTSGTATLVSHAAGSPDTASNGGQDIGSYAGSLSADGRYVTFFSGSTDLVPGMVDDNDIPDLFLYDRVTRKTTLISHASGQSGVTANGAILSGVISADGNYIAFASVATNLVPGQDDNNGRPGGVEQGGDLFLYHRPSGTTVLITGKSGSATATGNGHSVMTGISADGSVVFTSSASDLIAGASDTNGSLDVFLYHRSSKKVILVSRAAGSPLRSAGGFSVGGQVSADGRWIAFHSNAQNLISHQIDPVFNYDEFLYDRVKGEMRLVSHATGAPQTAVGVVAHKLSADGRWIAFSSDAINLVAGQTDTNGKLDVFLYDRTTGTTSLVTHAPGSPTTTTSGASDGVGLEISPDGRYVVFSSPVTDLVPRQRDNPGTLDIFLYDRSTRNLSLVSHRPGLPRTTANGPSFGPKISADGRSILFDSLASDLESGSSGAQKVENVFVYNLATAAVEPISRQQNP
jgi:Tol biopolymer transport system component